MKPKQIEFPGVDGSIFYKRGDTVTAAADFNWNESIKKLNINGTTNVNGGLNSNTYMLGYDLQIVPVAGGQSVIRSYWGLQIGGLRAAEMYDPSSYALIEPFAAENTGVRNRCCVLISTGSYDGGSFGSVGMGSPLSLLGIFRKSWQTNGNFLECFEPDNTSSKASIDFEGNYKGKNYTATGYIAVGNFTVAQLPVDAPDGAIAFASNGCKFGESSGAGTGVLAVRMNGSWTRSTDYQIVTA